MLPEDAPSQHCPGGCQPRGESEYASSLQSVREWGRKGKDKAAEQQSLYSSLLQRWKKPLWRSEDEEEE